MIAIHQDAAQYLALEEDDMLAEAAELTKVQEVEETEDAARAMGITDALEDLAFVADTITEIKPEEASVIAITADLATAGTDVKVNELIPGLESLEGGVNTHRLKALAARLRHALTA